MEDAATAEISRTSIWQWIRHGKTLSDNTPVTKELFRQYLQEEAEVVKNEVGEQRWNNEPFSQALSLLEEITTAAGRLSDPARLPTTQLITIKEQQGHYL